MIYLQKTICIYVNRIQEELTALSVNNKIDATASPSDEEPPKAKKRTVLSISAIPIFHLRLLKCVPASKLRRLVPIKSTPRKHVATS